MARAPFERGLDGRDILSASTKASACALGSRSGLPSSASASGARPASMAICALVRRLGLKGR